MGLTTPRLLAVVGLGLALLRPAEGYNYYTTPSPTKHYTPSPTPSPVTCNITAYSLATTNESCSLCTKTYGCYWCKHTTG